MYKKLICLFFSIFMLSLTGSVYADLVGHWMLDEGSGTTAFDSSGNGNDGTLMNNPDLEDPTWITGINGGAMEFHGTGVALTGGDYIDCGNDASLDITGPISIALWIRPDADDPEGKGATGGETSVMAKAMNPDWSWQVRYGWYSPTPYMSFTFNTTPRAWAYVGRNLERYEWVHIACSHDDATLKCYLNGEETDSTPMGQITSSNTPVIIGSGGWGSDWTGAIDDVRIYDHALTEAEILGTMVGEVWPYAYGPNPEDGALLTETWVSLSWKPGPLAASHDIYIGDSFDDVNEGVNETFRVNQDTTFYVAGFPTYPYPDGLVNGETYYWRIDEVNEAEPNSPWKGKVWSFMVPPRIAYYPDPADGAEFVDLNAILSWTAGFNGGLHTVYIGDNFDDVNNATGGESQGLLTYSPDTLELGKVYYWRVDEYDGTDTYKGDIWSFTTPGAVGNPVPANGAADVKMTSTLSWTPADSAASHEVYFGTDKYAVRNADKNSPEYKGPKELGAESYDPGKLTRYATYYWRVDEVDSLGGLSKGPLWSFTTANFISVDNFEDYDVGNNEIWWAWKDGLGYSAHDNEPAYSGNGTGSAVGDETTPSYMEETIVHGGGKSMPLVYDNNKLGSSNYSEVELALSTTRDWTEEGVGTLTIWFRGKSDNVAEPLYVAIANSTGTPAIVIHDDPAATQVGVWTQWVISLQTIADQGIDLTNVDKIAIGLGTRGNLTTPGGAGKMYFDDIRLDLLIEAAQE